MKIQLASDLHLERLESKFPDERLITPAPGAELLVLAGDIHDGVKSLHAFQDWPVGVVVVAGNHDFYGKSWEQTRVDLRKEARGLSNITVLDNDVFEYGGVRFLGCTLWTDFRMRGHLQRSCMEVCEREMLDFFNIHTQAGALRAQDVLEDHELSRMWLEHQLAKPFDGKTVVITHHGCHPLSIHPKYLQDKATAGFVSDLTPLLFHADLWLHGHVHNSFDYKAGRCRVVVNPAGYVLNRSTAKRGEHGFDFELENTAFNPQLVIDI